MVGHDLSWHKDLNLILSSIEKETEMGRGRRQETLAYIVYSAERTKTHDKNRTKFQRQQIQPIQLKCLDVFDCG